MAAAGRSAAVEAGAGSLAAGRTAETALQVAILRKKFSNWLVGLAVL